MKPNMYINIISTKKHINTIVQYVIKNFKNPLIYVDNMEAKW